MRSRFRGALVAGMAVVALSAMAASSAFALGGPEWLVAGAKLTGTKTIGSAGIGSFHIKIAGFAAVMCRNESSSGGEMTGGNPGTGSIEFQFSGCSIEKKTVEECAVSTGSVRGEIKIPFQTVLAYPVGGAGSTVEADEALVPTESETLTFAGENCGTISGTKAILRAHGTEIKEPAFDKKCGLLAEVGKIESGKFVKGASGAEAKEGALAFPEPAITKGELWQPTPGVFTGIECKLEVGTYGFATVIGLSKVETTTKEEFGWKV
jgi:hypothetical protein